MMVFSRAGALLLLVAVDRSVALVSQSRMLGVRSEGGEEGICFAKQEDSVWWYDDFINVLALSLSRVEDESTRVTTSIDQWLAITRNILWYCRRRTFSRVVTRRS
jgi:hypothetical protein